ncbi:HIT family protein [Pacificibacter marinus]|uniref:HIT-like protein n=1 Tax=Pacificibacter marinus TaxID=658057 RepID=A0A1Y5RY86_9RHOB|nr:HIT family protein [Pacificibacter marinus]SEK39983.1 histidine triad (HIT) family protein [Pacificibacter marinus]SLN25373.1 HIT-like protein [Pacificibacter marinus]
MACIFCEIAAGKAPAYILFQNETVLVFLSLEGHPLVVPQRHFAGLDELDAQTGAAIMQTAGMVATALRDVTDCEGVNLILSDGQAAGQEVFHLHMHVKPRWTDDRVVLTWDTSTTPAIERTALAQALKTRLARLV